MLSDMIVVETINRVYIMLEICTFFLLTVRIRIKLLNLHVLEFTFNLYSPF